jgi:hypothetical protein
LGQCGARHSTTTARPGPKASRSKSVAAPAGDLAVSMEAVQRLDDEVAGALQRAGAVVRLLVTDQHEARARLDPLQEQHAEIRRLVDRRYRLSAAVEAKLAERLELATPKRN